MEAVSDLDCSGLEGLVMKKTIASLCCDAPAVDEDGHWSCAGCGQACEAVQVLEVITLGEEARAVASQEGNRDLSLWVSFSGIAVAYGSRWVGPSVAGFEAIREHIYPGSWRDPECSGRAYEEFRERFFREVCLSGGAEGREESPS